MARNLRDQVLAITGASSGIGAATAVEAARRGMHVALSARRVDRLEEVAVQVRALGRRALVVPCDVSRDADVRNFIDATMKEFARLDAVFANAGYGLFAPVAETTDALMREIFEANYYGTLRVIHAALPIFRNQRRGHILICSSAVSELGLPFYGAYSATKSAQDSIASALRAELQHESIFVTSVHPVGTATEFSQSVVSSKPRPATPNTPRPFRQSSEHVARCIVRVIGRGKPEVWPSIPARFFMGLATMFPRLGQLALRVHYRRMLQRNAAGP